MPARGQRGARAAARGSRASSASRNSTPADNSLESPLDWSAEITSNSEIAGNSEINDTQLTNFDESDGEPDGSAAHSRLIWTEAMERAYLEKLIDTRRRGAAGDTGFKQKTWKECVPVVLEHTPPEMRPMITSDRMKNKHGAYKKEYRIWRECIDQSGWTRNPPLVGPAYAAPMVMEAYFIAHPRARKYGIQAIDHEHMLDELFDDAMAWGRHAESFEEIAGVNRSRSASSSGGPSQSSAAALSQRRLGIGAIVESDLELDEGLTPQDQSDQARPQQSRQVISPSDQAPVAPRRRGPAARSEAEDQEDSQVAVEMRRGLAAIADSLASKQSIVSKALTIINTEFRDLGARRITQLGRLLVVPQNAEQLVNFTYTDVRKQLIEEWLGESIEDVEMDE